MWLRKISLPAIGRCPTHSILRTGQSGEFRQPLWLTDAYAFFAIELTAFQADPGLCDCKCPGEKL
jgi:hypothetical protein